jgi:prepilin-type processing-associated H-X9-DG protein
MFVTGRHMKFRDTLDGLSNTIMCGEIATDLGDNDKRTTVATNVGAHAAPNEKNQCRLDPSYAEPYIDPERPQFWTSAVTKQVVWGRGYRWHDYMPPYSQMTTILAPNAQLCSEGTDHRDVVSPPSSRHQGGVHVLMGDGAVKFITDSIEAGNKNAPQVSDRAGSPAGGSKSPYGLWGALGSRSAKEVIDGEF